LVFGIFQITEQDTLGAGNGSRSETLQLTSAAAAVALSGISLVLLGLADEVAGTGNRQAVALDAAGLAKRRAGALREGGIRRLDLGAVRDPPHNVAGHLVHGLAARHPDLGAEALGHRTHLLRGTLGVGHELLALAPRDGRTGARLEAADLLGLYLDGRALHPGDLVLALGLVGDLVVALVVGRESLAAGIVAAVGRHLHQVMELEAVLHRWRLLHLEAGITTTRELATSLAGIAIAFGRWIVVLGVGALANHSRETGY